MVLLGELLVPFIASLQVLGEDVEETADVCGWWGT